MAIAIGLAVAFAILTAEKTGIRGKVIERAPKIISKLVECDLCLSFWSALIVSVILMIIFADTAVLLCPILSPPITRTLL